MKLQIFRRSFFLLILAVFPVISFGQTNAIDSPQIQNVISRSYSARIGSTLVYNALRQISGAQATFQATAGNGNYASTIKELADLNLIDGILGNGMKYGYYFVVSATESSLNSPPFFKVTATPSRYPKTGVRSYYLDSTGEIRGADKNGATATVNDPVIIICENSETEAIQTLRAIYGAEVTYQSNSGFGNFGTLQNLSSNGLIDSSTATGGRCGYNFAVTTVDRSPNSPPSFYINAVPQQYPSTGRRSFYVDESGVVRGADRNGQPAGADDSPIQD